MNNQDVALAGEFFTLAQLSLQGLVGTLTLGHTKHVDILVANPENGKTFRLEVKTASKGPYKSKQFGTNFEWHMAKKHETIHDDNLFYCFVLLQSPEIMPRFFIVPSKDVAKFVKEDDEYWHNLPRTKIVKKTDMRVFRLQADEKSRGLDRKRYENNWDYFKK
ncbi:MAG: hypothetical protein V1776_01780 [Candidatus Diapherotrites archaeon]